MYSYSYMDRQSICKHQSQSKICRTITERSPWYLISKNNIARCACSHYCAKKLPWVKYCTAAQWIFDTIWWVCLVPTSGTRFASDVGYRMSKIWHGCTRKIIFMMTSNSLTENEEHNIPSQILKINFGLHASVIFETPICVVSRTFVGSADPKL